MHMFRQGDVLIRSAKITKAAKPVEPDAHGRVVLAYGEVTGHAHAFHERVRMFRDDGAGRTFIRAEADALLKHEEHSTIRVPAGDYEVVRQVEYSPQAIRQVAD